MKIKSKRQLLVKEFVQSVSSPTTFGKRYKKVCKLLSSRPDLTEEHWFYIWRGLYYSIWYTEMGKGCEALATRIGTNDDLLMIITGFKSLTNDWYGIDAFRVDKYMFLVRIMINNCLKMQLNSLCNKQVVNESSDKNSTQLSTDNTNGNEKEDNDEEVNGKDDDNEPNEESITDENVTNGKKQKNKKWKKKFNSKKNKSLKKEIEFPIEMRAKLIDKILTIIKSSIGLTLHINDIFIDELVKVIEEMKPNCSGSEKYDIIFDMLLPFVKLLALTEDNRVRTDIKDNIFVKLKNEIIISESINLRKLVLEKFVSAMVSIGSVQEVAKKNRDSIYNIVGLYKSKLNQLKTSNETKGVKRRKIVTKIGNQKKVKYELTSETPFVRSIVPIAVV